MCLSKAEIVARPTKKMIKPHPFDILMLIQLVMAVRYQYTVIAVKMKRLCDAQTETCALVEMRTKVFSL